MNEVFSFVNATHLISKAQLWKERDKAIKKKHEKLNNEVLPKVAYDKQTRIGYKQHVSVAIHNLIQNTDI